MHTEYHKEYSRHLGRDMEFKVYGHGGKPVLVFPCQNGRFFDWEGFGMLDTLQDYLDAGRIQLFTADTIDAQTVSFREGDPYQRIRLHEAWYRYLTEELLPRIHEINGTGNALLSTGFSMGAYHAANVFFRRPDLFDSVIALSGIYDTQDMYGGYMDEVVYANDPCASLLRHAGGPPLYQHVQCPQNHSLRGPGRLGRAALGGNPPSGRGAQAKRHPGMGGLLGIRCQP